MNEGNKLKCHPTNKANYPKMPTKLAKEMWEEIAKNDISNCDFRTEEIGSIEWPD